MSSDYSVTYVSGPYPRVSNRALLLTNAIAVAMTLLRSAPSHAQSVPCTDCGKNFTYIDANSVRIRQPSVLVFGGTKPTPADSAAWGRQAARLGYALLVLDSMPRTIYVADETGVILSGVSLRATVQFGFVFVSRHRGVGDIHAGAPSGLRLVAHATWYGMPPVARMYLSMWPLLLSVVLIVCVGVSTRGARPTVLAAVASVVVILGWSVWSSLALDYVERGTMVGLRNALVLTAIGVWVPILTAFTSVRLARRQSGTLARVVLPSAVGFIYVACCPYIMLVAACMFGDCI